MKKKIALFLCLILVLQFVAPSMGTGWFTEEVMAATRTKVVIPNTNFYNINNTMDSTNGYFKYGGEAPVNSVVGNVNTPTIINMTIGQTQKSVINGREVYNLFEEDLEIHLDMNFGKTSTKTYDSKEYIDEMNRGMTVMLKGGNPIDVPGGGTNGMVRV